MQSILSFAYASKEAYDLKQKITSMQEHAKTLERENNELSQALEVEKQKCMTELQPLIQQQQEMDEKHQQEVMNIQMLTQNITQAHLQESMLIKALSREVNIHNKYQLKIELYSQELELYEGRKAQGVADKCHLMSPLFKKYESIVKVRSMGGMRKNWSEKDHLVVLNNELNQHKIVVQGLQNRNRELKQELSNERQLCEDKKSDIMRIIQATNDELQMALKQADMLRVELDEAVRVVQGLTVELQQMKEKNRQLRAESEDLKNRVESFRGDLECYIKLSELKINYQ